MHLWPSLRIRESFKKAYLEKLEWNLYRMKSQKKQQRQSQSESPTTSQQKLLDDADNMQGEVAVDSKNHFGWAVVLFREVLLVLSCCYCCFCCGACVEEDS